MDSVMNFLADNYIWFFVAAGVLLFALIGFIIDSKKKQKSEFKGESIEENKEEPIVQNTTEPIVQNTTEPIVQNTIEIGQQVIDSNINNIPSENNENTMEINDIPLTENNFIGSRVEFNNETEPLTEELNLEEKPEATIEELDLEDNNNL